MKGYEVSVENWGRLNKACVLGFFSESLCLGGKDAPFLCVWGGHLSHEGLMTCFRGEGRWEGHRDLLASVIFSNPSTLNIQYAKVPYLRVVCSEWRH